MVLDDFLLKTVSKKRRTPNIETMKKITVLALLLVPIVILAQRKPKIKGNREVTEVREELPVFNAIELNDNLDIVLKKSFGEGYEITADDNLVDVIKFEVEDSTLVISSFYTITAKKKLDIVINFKELKAITLREGKITTTDIVKTDQLYVNVFGSSRLNLKADAFVANVNMEDTSKGDFNFDVDSLNVTAKNRADVKMYAVTGAKQIELQNNAVLDIEGSSESMQLKMFNDTKYRGAKMQAADVSAQLEASTVARLHATRSLELQSRGSAKTFLHGEPKITLLEFLDTSQLLKKTD